MLTLPGADTTVHVNEPAAETQGNNGRNTMPTLAPLKGQQRAQIRTKPSLTKVASMLNEDWFAMQDIFGTDVLICRPGVTTFARQTYVFCWSLASDCAVERITTEVCKCRGDWQCASPPVLLNGMLPATDTNIKHSQNTMMNTTLAWAQNMCCSRPPPSSCNQQTRMDEHTNSKAPRC